MVFLPPLPEVHCQNFLDFQNPWRKEMERCGLRFKKLMLIKGVTSPRKIFFVFRRILPRSQLRTWNVDIGSQKCTGIILLELISKGLFNKMKIFLFLLLNNIDMSNNTAVLNSEFFVVVNFCIVRKYGLQSWIQHNALEKKLCFKV